MPFEVLLEASVAIWIVLNVALKLMGLYFQGQ